ncbi:MAG: MscL family protein [Patescibacteria group bacterium]
MDTTVKKSQSLAAEFFEFLKKFGVIGLAIGVVVGGAVKTFVDEIVRTMVTPLVNYVLSLVGFKAGGAIDLPKLTEGAKAESLLVGDLIGATINFLVLMLIVFIVVKVILSKFLSESDMGNTGV